MSKITVLFSFSFYRFLILTPYQYTYVNYSYLYLLESKGKWEHDYWGVSYKELVKKIKETHSEDEIKNFKIADCGGGDWTLIYYLKKEYINQANGSVVKRISHLTTDQEFRVRILAEPPSGFNIIN